MLLSACQSGDPPTLRIATLNLAHGRGTTPTRKVVTRKRAESNLRDAASMLVRERIEVAALQEIDASSLWSGRFDHVPHLASHGEYEYHFHGLHVTKSESAGQLQYGTAILSKRPLSHTESRVFTAAPFGSSNWIGRKGFVIAEAELDGRRIAVVSLHLDTFKRGTRLANARELVAFIQQREAALVLMGDFNCGWGGDSALNVIIDELGVQGFEAQSVEDFESYPAKKPRKRIDWILISPELRFIEYRTSADVVSDHRAVIAEIAWREDTP